MKKKLKINNLLVYLLILLGIIGIIHTIIKHPFVSIFVIVLIGFVLYAIKQTTKVHPPSSYKKTYGKQGKSIKKTKPLRKRDSNKPNLTVI